MASSICVIKKKFKTALSQIDCIFCNLFLDIRYKSNVFLRCAEKNHLGTLLSVWERTAKKLATSAQKLYLTYMGKS